MKKISLLFVLSFVLTVPAFAQLYSDKHDGMIEGLDTAVIKAEEFYADVPIAGAADDLTPTDERYQQMTAPLDDVALEHFYTAEQSTTIVISNNERSLK
ncbi:MAG: hypothetical protein HQL18_02800 [Candidatus Omnitrophica bacterium]|nr:hypothetical protein [Candidatus Omnitrophota bacterium]